VKRAGWALAALLGGLLTLCVSAAPQQAPLPENAQTCGVDTTRPPQRLFARGFEGGWLAVSEEQWKGGTWGQTAALWPAADGGTFVELSFRAEPGEEFWAQFTHYCFGPGGHVLWIESTYNSAAQESRRQRLEFNLAGTATAHKEECVNPNTGEARPADEGCKEFNAFPIVKQLESFQFLKRELPGPKLPGPK